MLEIDAKIEKLIFGRLEPSLDMENCHSDWEKDADGRYNLIRYDVNTRAFYVRDIWPREVSTNIYLAWELAERFLIQLTPSMALSNRKTDKEFTPHRWIASSTLRPGVTVEEETAPMAICVMVLKILEGIQ